MSLSSSSPAPGPQPWISTTSILLDGRVLPWTGATVDATSPILGEDGQRIPLGKIPLMGEQDAQAAVAAAKRAWNTGRGLWPQKSLEERIAAIEQLVSVLKSIRDDIVNVLMWEICKNSADAAAEFDRTMLYIEATIAAVRKSDDGEYKVISGVRSRVRRAAIGVMLVMGPFNYPFNETYSTLIPGLLMGNTVVMKVPKVGGLAHVLTMEAYAQCLPPGVINFISGNGRETMGPAMKAGVDVLALIGGSKSADAIIREHPHPHRLKIWLSLEGKNLGIVTQDADVAVAVEQCALGSLTYNGQRCTAIKLIFVHASIADVFVQKFVEKVSTLKAGLPWEAGVLITPLPEPGKPKYMRELIDDAVAHGASVYNASGPSDGGQTVGNIVRPAVVGPVTPAMKLWHEEQFGPVVPIAVYNDASEVVDYIEKMPYGQQAAVFSTSEATTAPLIDVLSTAVGRINLNTQCSRGPDVLPFSGRRSSALGTLSVTEALSAFSVETVVACKEDPVNKAVFEKSAAISSFLAPYAKL